MKHTNPTRLSPATALSVALLLVASCATQDLSPPPTTAQVTAAEAAVRLAREAGPVEGGAGQHLQMAQKELAESKERSANGNHRGASFLLARAQADAELSQVLRRREKAVADAEVIERHLAETRVAATVPPPASSTQMAMPPAGVSPPPSTFGTTGTTAAPSAVNPSGSAAVPAPSTSTVTKPVAPDWGHTPPPSSIAPSPTTPTPSAP